MLEIGRREVESSCLDVQKQGHYRATGGVLRLELLQYLHWLFLLFLIQTALPAFAQANEPTDVFTDTSTGRSIYCGLVGSSWVPVVKMRGGTYRSLALEIRTVGKKLKIAGTTRQRTSLQNKVKKLRALRKGATPVCAMGPSSGDTPFVTPTPSTPAASPTPGTPSVGCFLAGGITAPGCFGIPTQLSGSIDRGQSLYQQQCFGCHKSRPALPFDKLEGAFSRIPQMLPYKPGQQDLADLVAYLNRFNF